MEEKVVEFGLEELLISFFGYVVRGGSFRYAVVRLWIGVVER